MDAFSQLNLDHIRIGAAAVLACFLCASRLRTVLTVDALVSIAEGICTVLFAKEVLQTYTKGVSVDIQHQYLTMTRVAWLLMPSLTWLFCFGTTDTTCLTALLVSRLVGYTFTAAFMAVDHYRMDIFSDWHLMYSVVPCGLWVLVYTVQLIRTGGRVSISVRTYDLNRPLKLDLFVVVVFALADITAPKFFGNYVGRSVEPLHAYLHRINGALALGAACLPWIGQRFSNPDNKRSVLNARVLACTGWLLGTVAGYNKGWLPNTDSTVAFMGQAFLLMLPALYGCFSSNSGRLWGLPSLKSFDPFGILGKVRRSMLVTKKGTTTPRSESPAPGGPVTRSRSRTRSSSAPRTGLTMVLRPRQGR